jgi:hypothetical protein
MAGLGEPEAEPSFRTVTRGVLTVTEPSNGFVRSARRTVAAGLGSLLERCKVELARVDGGREIEHGGTDQAQQSAAEAERGPSGDEQNAEYCLRAVGGSCEFPAGFSVIPGQRHVDPKA